MSSDAPKDGGPPSLVMKCAPCVHCGARTENQAETMCRSTQDWTGEHSCPGEFDRNGRSVVPTAASLKALDDYYGRLMAAECAKEDALLASREAKP